VDEAIIIPSGLTVVGNLSFWLGSPSATDLEEEALKYQHLCKLN